jgi:hypothetical protein
MLPAGLPATYTRLPREALRPGVTRASAADTAWVIASPDTRCQLVHRAGYSYDQLEDWIRNTLTAALLPDTQHRRPGPN